MPDTPTGCSGCSDSPDFVALPTFLVQYPTGSQRGFWTEESANAEALLYGGEIVAVVLPGEEAKGYQFLTPEEPSNDPAQEPIDA